MYRILSLFGASSLQPIGKQEWLKYFEIKYFITIKLKYNKVLNTILQIILNNKWTSIVFQHLFKLYDIFENYTIKCISFVKMFLKIIQNYWTWIPCNKHIFSSIKSITILLSILLSGNIFCDSSAYHDHLGGSCEFSAMFSTWHEGACNERVRQPGQEDPKPR